MDIKFGRYFCENLTNKDWVLDNGSSYQIMTRTHRDNNRVLPTDLPITISKKLFAQLKKEGKIVPAPEINLSNCLIACRAWRFNVVDTEGDNGTK